MSPDFGVFVLNNGIGYSEVAKLIAFGLQELGVSVESGGKYDFYKTNSKHRIIFCFKPIETFAAWHPGDDWRKSITENDIYFNTEPFRDRNIDKLGSIDVIRERMSWDYSISNLDYLQDVKALRYTAIKLG